MHGVAHDAGDGDNATSLLRAGDGDTEPTTIAVDRRRAPTKTLKSYPTLLFRHHNDCMSLFLIALFNLIHEHYVYNYRWKDFVKIELWSNTCT